MTREELHILKRSIDYLIEEIDPQTGYKVDDTILKSKNNKRILMSVSELIDRLLVLDVNPFYIDKRKKYAFYISESDIQKIELSDEPITISRFTYTINVAIDSRKMKKIRFKTVNTQLINCF